MEYIPSSAPEMCINRNIVECKVDLGCLGCKCKTVLIETLWNVKHVKQWLFQKFGSVLIETLWNVKHEEVAEAILKVTY